VSARLLRAGAFCRNPERFLRRISRGQDRSKVVRGTDMRDTESIARGVFVEIAKRFPSLQMAENHDDPVEISITMPAQPGLRHKVWLCLQNHDELGFGVGHFYIEFFPCTKSYRAEEYLDAVTGFLAGKYRVLEYYSGRRCYKAKLQKPRADRWHTIATWAQFFGIPGFSTRTVRELRN